MNGIKVEAELRRTADRLVAEMLAAGVAEKKFYKDERGGKRYFNLITPAAFEKQLVVICVLGYPEKVGVWSYTLVRQSRIREASMEPYFTEFTKRDLGLVAIDPNYFTPDLNGDTFVYQLGQAISDVTSGKKMGFVGFSMGGRILVDFLEQRPQLLDRVAGLVLIDPTLSNRLELKNVRKLLDYNTLLIASEGEVHSPGKVASGLLDIPSISFPGIHGEMPNKALSDVIRFYEKRLGQLQGAS